MLISPYLRAKGIEIFFEKYYIPPKKKLIKLSYLKPLIIYVGLFLFTLCSNNTVKAQETTLSCGSNFIASYCDINLTDTINNLKIDSIYGTNSIPYGVTNSDLKDVLYEEDYQNVWMNMRGAMIALMEQVL